MAEKMNVYQKLQRCRVELQATELKKSGENKFAGYKYFELGDFMPTVNNLFNQHGLCSVTSFGADIATLTIYNSDKPEESVQFTSPMSTAALKGCHDVQNLGAVQTYLRRYLIVAAMEITEADVLDRTHGKDASAKNLAGPASVTKATPATELPPADFKPATNGDKNAVAKALSVLGVTAKPHIINWILKHGGGIDPNNLSSEDCVELCRIADEMVQQAEREAIQAEGGE